MSYSPTKGTDSGLSHVYWDAGHDFSIMFGYEKFAVASTVDMEIVRGELTFGFEEWIGN